MYIQTYLWLFGWLIKQLQFEIFDLGILSVYNHVMVVGLVIFCNNIFFSILDTQQHDWLIT